MCREIAQRDENLMVAFPEVRVWSVKLGTSKRVLIVT